MLIPLVSLTFPGRTHAAANGTQLLLVQIEGEQMNSERATRIEPCGGWHWNAGRLLMGMLGVFLFLMQVSVARAQRLDGSLRVEVGDSSGGAIVAARVRGPNEATGDSVSTT